MRFDPASVEIDGLGPRHDRSLFFCGNQSLDLYLRTQASQDMRRGAARAFVAAMMGQPDRPTGFFTLRAAMVLPEDLPSEMARKLPRLPVPAALVGRLAVDRSFQGRGLGGILLADAVKKTRIASAVVAMSVIVVDPVDENAKKFYSTFGFQWLRGPQRRMFLPVPG